VAVGTGRRLQGAEIIFIIYLWLHLLYTDSQRFEMEPGFGAARENWPYITQGDDYERIKYVRQKNPPGRNPHMHSNYPNPQTSYSLVPLKPMGGSSVIAVGVIVVPTDCRLKPYP